MLNKLIYEGKYTDGVKNGKGKKYDGDGKLIFEGKYKNGKNEIELFLVRKILMN